MPIIVGLLETALYVDGMPEGAGVIPGHDGAGPLHMALDTPADPYDAWHHHLEAADVLIQSEMEWPTGGRSICFEDPDGHVLEVATPGPWPNH